MLSGHSVTGILHFINKCPIDWYSKKQGTVKTATFGSEANAAKTAMEQIINLHGTLCYMGVPLGDSSYMFGETRLSLTVVHCLMPSFTRGIQCYPTIMSMKPLQVEWSSSSISLVKLTQLTSLVSIGDTSRSGSNSNHSCSGSEIHGSCLKRSTAKKSTTASHSGETLPTKVVAIEPILRSVKYEARSHCHSVLEEIVYIQEFHSAVSRVHLYMSKRS